jgi:manganese/zinc/iron transport system permease protein
VTSVLALLSGHTALTVAGGAAVLGAVAGMLGAFALLRRQSLLGDTLSHAALPGVCAGFLLAGARDPGAIMAGAFATGGVAALSVMAIARHTRIKPDAAMGIVLSLFFAAGLVLLSVAQARGGGAQAGLSAFLFGQAAAMLSADLKVMAVVGAVLLLLVAAFWKEIKLATFDPDLARVQGLPVGAIETGLTVMLAIAIVLGLQLVGVVLMVAMLIAPAVAARQWARRLGAMVVLSAAFGVIAGLGGAMVSAASPGLATGPVAVLIATAIAAASLILAPGRGVLAQRRAARSRHRSLAEERVLASLAGLGRAHGDLGRPSEAGLLVALHGPSSRRILERLAGRGLVRRVLAAPGATPRWELTEAGQAAATAAGDRAPVSSGAGGRG